MQPSPVHLLGAVGSSLVLATIFGVLWTRERAPHLIRWTFAWLLAAAARVVMMWSDGAVSPLPLDPVWTMLVVCHVALWLDGTRQYSGRSDPVGWPWISSLGMGVFGLALWLAGADPLMQALPIHILLVVAYLWSGTLVVRQSAFGVGGWMAGGGLLVLGAHTLATLPQFVQGDFGAVVAVERVVGVVIGLGTVFAHIDVAYDKIYHREEMILHAEEGLLQLDLAAQPVEANPALARLLGCGSVAEVLQADLHPLVGELTAGSRTGLLSGSERQVQFRRFDGERVWLTLRVRAHRDMLGMPIGYQVHVRDSTKSREMSERLQRAEKLNALGQLAGGIAHDFNNLLTVIDGSLEMLGDGPADPDRRARMIGRARNATTKGAALTRRLLDFARHQPGQLEVFDLLHVARHSAALFQGRLASGIELSVDGRGTAWVKGDPGQFGRVVANLILNACDAMPEGGQISIDVTGQGDLVRLEVQDTGPGIPAEYQRRIFEPFFTTREGGTGLGLAIVFGAVTGAGGTVDLHSDSTGTSFVLTLPASEPPPIDDDDRDTIPPEPHRRTVLIADDEKDVLDLAAEMLADAGYRVLQASSGPEALEVARGHGHVDLLITDVKMPEMKGTDLADALQQRVPSLPVLFLSAYPETDAQLLEETRLFLGKPFRRRQLLDAVAEALSLPALPDDA